MAAATETTILAAYFCHFGTFFFLNSFDERLY
jgi:hypothetical protein